MRGQNEKMPTIAGHGGTASERSGLDETRCGRIARVLTTSPVPVARHCRIA